MGCKNTSGISAGCKPEKKNLNFPLRGFNQSILGAFEKFHGAVIDHYGGDDTRVFQEVCEVGKWLEQLEEMAGSLTHAQVAVIYDWENRWAFE